MGDEHQTMLRISHVAVDRVGDDFESVDVQTGVGLVKDGEPRVQQFQLSHLGAFLLATRESLIDGTLSEVRIKLLTGQGLVDLLDPGAQLRGPAFNSGAGSA